MQPEDHCESLPFVPDSHGPVPVSIIVGPGEGLDPETHDDEVSVLIRGSDAFDPSTRIDVDTLRIGEWSVLTEYPDKGAMPTSSISTSGIPNNTDLIVRFTEDEFPSGSETPFIYIIGQGMTNEDHESTYFVGADTVATRAESGESL